MAAADDRVWELPNVWDECLVGWDVSQAGPLPPPTGHPRIVLGPYLQYSQLDPGEWLRLLGGREAFLEACGPEDIVWVPLLRSITNHPAWDWDTEKCADFDAHCELIEELAPHVRGILVGNMGPEFCAHIGGGQRFRRMDALKLIVHLSAVVTLAGGTPYIGTLDWTLLMDCAMGGHLRDVIAPLGVTQICFTPYTLHPDAFFDRDHGHLNDGQLKWQIEHDGQAPSPKFVDYIKSTPVWADLNWLDGLEAGNDKLLKDMGFARGCL